MRLPSPACATCKKRRIKCDATRPICGRCSKADHRCVWNSPVESAGLQFKSENAYAQGQARRPRRSNVGQPLTAVAIRPALPESTETLALNFWVQNWTDKPSAVPDIGREYLTYTPSHYISSEAGSSLRLAVAALSLTVFGRTHNASSAVAAGERYYARAVVKARSDIQEIGNSDVDVLVLATMLMTHYETATYQQGAQMRQSASSLTPQRAGASFWQYVCHYLGTAGLLKARQSQPEEQHMSLNLPLYRAVRRPIVRAAILRGMRVPDWLQNAAAFGEEGPALRLDTLMIRVAEHRAVGLQWQTGSEAGQCEQLNDFLVEGLLLDAELSAWQQQLEKEYGYRDLPIHIHKTKGALYNDKTAHTYRTYSHASVWNRYRATRMIVQSSIARTIHKLKTYTTLEHSLYIQRQVFLTALRELAAEISQSIPFYFNFEPPARENVVPKVVTHLAWPLTVAIGTEGVPETDLAWFRHTLRIIGIALGDSVLECVAQGNEFEF